MAAGAVDLFANLGAVTIQVDEPTYIAAGWDYVHGLTTRNLEHPYLTKQLIGLSQVAFGRSLFAARLPGAIFAALTAVVLFDIGRRLAGRWTGLLAAGLWLLLPQLPGTFAFRLDRLATLEPPMIFFAVVATWLSVLARQRSDARLLLGAAAAAGLAASAKFPGAVGWVPVAITAVALADSWPRRARAMLVSFAVAAVFFWLPYAVQGDWRLGGLRFAVEFQAQHARLGHSTVVAGRVYDSAPWWAAWWWQSRYLGGPLTASLWALAAIALWHYRRGLRALQAVTPAFALLLGSVLAVALSPLRLPHYHALWIPGFVLAVALGVRALYQRGLAARVVAGLLLLPAAPLIVGTTVHAVTVRPTDYALLAPALQSAGASHGAVMVWGYTDLAGFYLEPTFRVTGSESGQAVPRAIVVDPNVADRQGGTETARQVAALTPTCSAPQKIDRLLLYLCAGG